MKAKEFITEKWSEKYKSSINCSHPNGFSQRAHCAGKRKHNESIEMEMVCEACGMCETHGNPMMEVKQRLDAKCWTGKKIGNPKTKVKGGVRVNNCVPAESVNEMDKSQTPPGRDGSNDSDAGKKEYTAKATTPKKVAKDAEKILNKELNKKQGVAEGASNIKEKIIKLYKQGLSDDEIASRLKIDSDDVKSVLDDYEWVADTTGEGEGVAEGLNIGPQIIYATGPKTMGANDVDLVFKDLRTGKIVAHVVGNNNSLQEFALPDGGGDGDNHPERPATYEIRMNNSKAPTYVAVGDPTQDSEHKVYKLGPKQPGAQAYYGMGVTLVSNLDWWSFLEKMLGEIMAEDDAIESGLVDRKSDGDLVFVKQQGVAEDTELAEEFDLIESIVEMIAQHNGVDAEVVWADLESLTEDELYVFAVTSDPLMEDWQKANKRDKTDGMSQKAVNAYRRENPGSKLKTAVTTKPSKLKKGGKASKRRKSYCSRSRGQMKMHSISCAKTPDKAICKARRRWNC